MSRNARRREAHRAGALRAFARLAGKIAVPSAGIGFALWGSAVMADLLLRNSGAPEVASLSFVSPAPAAVSPSPVSLNAIAPESVASKGRRVAAGVYIERRVSFAAEKHDRIAALESVAVLPARPAAAARFEQAVKDADLSSERLAALFGTKAVETEPPGRAAQAKPRQAKSKGSGALVAKAPGNAKAVASLVPPSAARFGVHAAEAGHIGTLLAYADHAPSRASAALAALSDAAPIQDGTLEPFLGALPEDPSLEPDYEDTPDAAPSPLLRSRPAPKAEEEDKDQGRGKTSKPARAEDEDRAKPGRAREEKRTERKLAYARPDNPNEKSRGGGGLFNNLFGARPSVGRGVAVYDISAAKVYMPDGSVLEAHSGIGNMADNPKYAHVKMKGPTPPHTYNLRMREKRFHGVEAIRMLPVDGRNKHGRDGFLTHSYLLRGGRAESHGCVAFKDYNKFLNAFKKGKIKQLVVVPGGGKAIMTAKNGRGA